MNQPSLPKIVLASSSLRRHQILQSAHIMFEIVHPKTDEIEDDNSNIIHTVTHNATIKAQYGASLEGYHNHLVIGCDTLVQSGPRVCSKPRDFQDALEMFQLYEQYPIHVITAITGIYQKNQKTLTDTSTIKMQHLPKQHKEDILKKLYTPHASGSFTIEGLGGFFLDSIHGSYNNILGFPLHTFGQICHHLGFFWGDFIK